MTQVVWKGTLYFGCATQYCPYGLANAGSVEPYFTVCNYKDPGKYFFFTYCVWLGACVLIMLILLCDDR